MCIRDRAAAADTRQLEPLGHRRDMPPVGADALRTLVSVSYTHLSTTASNPGTQRSERRPLTCKASLAQDVYKRQHPAVREKLEKAACERFGYSFLRLR